VKRLIILTLLVTLLSGCRFAPCHLDCVREMHLQKEQAILDARDQLFDHPLTVDEIVAIALDCNLELYVQRYQIAIVAEETKSNALKMLPELNLRTNSTQRTQNTAAFSQSLIPGVPPAPLSISRDEFIDTRNISLSLNVLDFGMAYFRARQSADNTAIQCFEYERIKEKMILEIVTNYWRVVAARKAVVDMDALLEKTTDEREKIESQRERRLTSDIDGLFAEDKLSEAEVGMLRFRRAYDTSMYELKKLMGLPPGVQFEVAVPENLFEEVEFAPIADLENAALHNRPELYSKDVEEILRSNSAKEALLLMFPSLRLFLGHQFDSNSFLLNAFWTDFGIEVLWNMLAIPSRAKAYKMVLKQKDRVAAERLLTTLTVLTEVHLAHQLVTDYQREYLAAKRFYEARRDLYLAIQNRVERGEYQPGYAVAFEARAYIAQLDMLAAYANFRGAIEQLNHSIGLPLYYYGSP